MKLVLDIKTKTQFIKLVIFAFLVGAVVHWEDACLFLAWQYMQHRNILTFTKIQEKLYRERLHLRAVSNNLETHIFQL